LFIDDDALPGDHDWLNRYVELFRNAGDGRLAGAGGPVWRRDSQDLEFGGGATSDYGMQRFGPAPADGHRWVQGVPGGNCAFLRSALLRIGGFDEQLPYYLDETDVCLRLSRAGFRVAYLPDNGVRHYSGPGAYRSGPLGRDWRVVTRSDTYF